MSKVIWPKYPDRVIAHDNSSTIVRGKKLKYQSPKKELNLVSGPSLLNPDEQVIHAVPMVEKWVDTVGLWSAENKFIEYTFVDSEKLYALSCYDDEGYECLYYDEYLMEQDAGYKKLKGYPGQYPTINTYMEAKWTKGGIPIYSPEPGFMSVEIINHGVDNIYIDSNVDVRLYTKDRVEHPYSKMYIPICEKFYAGFHARDTHLLPYNIEIQIAAEIIPLYKITDKKLMRRSIEFGNQY